MENCVFCKIASHQADSKIEYEDEDFIVFHDINPSAPVHVLIVPKDHMELSDDLTEWEKIGGRALLVARKVAKKLGVGESGFKLVMNCGRGAGQVVDHLHVHLMGGSSVEPGGET